MHELIGFLFLVPITLVVWMIALEIYDSIADRVERRRLRRAGELPSAWLDESPPAEPGFHVGGSGFHFEGSGSLMERRHRRRLELEPRGSFGFAAKWYQD